MFLADSIGYLVLVIRSVLTSRIARFSYVLALNQFDRFFFSSRRRHTRCSRDWSSDVCSSDLMDYVRATQVSAHVGQAMALVFGLIGLFSNPFLVFIAFFVWIGAAQEASMVQMRTDRKSVV